MSRKLAEQREQLERASACLSMDAEKSTVATCGPAGRLGKSSPVPAPTMSTLSPGWRSSSSIERRHPRSSQRATTS